MEVVLNPLSANGQCHSAEECFNVVSFYVACCEYCLPALDSDRISLLFDDHIEQRFLLGSQNLRASIAQCKAVKGGKDIIEKWYIYTRNRSKSLPLDSEIEVRFTANGIASSVEGIVYRYVNDAVGFWISLPRDTVCAVNNLTLHSHHGERAIRNAADFESFKAWLPIYEPNAKHRDKPYTAAGGEYVSPMPLSKAEAQDLLLTSLPDEAGTRWAFHKRTATFYCYRKTHVNREVFHGYSQSEEEVPVNIRIALRGQEITRSDHI
jgi:hypothetical protein